MQTAVLNVEDVEVALLERQFDPGTTLPMAFGDGDGGLGYVVGNADMAAGGPPRLASGGQVLKAAHRRAPQVPLGVLPMCCRPPPTTCPGRGFTSPHSVTTPPRHDACSTQVLLYALIEFCLEIAWEWEIFAQQARPY